MLLRNNLLFILVLSAFAFLFSNPVLASSEDDVVENSSNRSQILSTFVGKDRGELVDSFDERRDQHKILFYMGVLLLISVLLTAGFGVSMAMLGKEVFVPHMIFAGISVFLSIAHAVVAVVWFFPF